MLKTAVSMKSYKPRRFLALGSLMMMAGLLFFFAQQSAQASPLFIAPQTAAQQTESQQVESQQAEIQPAITAEQMTELTARLAQWGDVMPVIIGLNVPGYHADAVTASSAQEAAIANAQEALLTTLAGQNVMAVKQFRAIPYLALATDARGLQALSQQPVVMSVVEDRPLAPALNSSIPLIRADDAQALNFTGEGVSVAILDSGVDRLHPNLRNRVVAGACFSTTLFGAISSLCPGGAGSATTLNSGSNCAAGIAGCDHGTHVADTAASVASEANIISIQVFSRFNDQGACEPRDTAPCVRVFPSDLIRAMEHVHTLRNTFTIASANMSLGGGDFRDTFSCGVAALPLKIQIDIVRADRIAVVAAAGNDGFRNSMASPACIDSVISVGATTDADRVANFSNISLDTTLLAPGVGIVAAVPSNGLGNKNGTSMASPHVAGAIAILRQARSSLTVDTVEDILTSTGPFVTDNRRSGSVTKRRLDVFAALCRVISCDADDFRVLRSGDTLPGNLNPPGEIDIYTYEGSANERLTLRVNTTGNQLILPRIDLFDPNGTLVSTNTGGGGAFNALINNFSLPRTGRYQVRVRAGGCRLPCTSQGYQISASSQPVVENPRPAITRLTPETVTANLFASDFTIRITGNNFMRGSVARWNGRSRPTVFQNATTLFMTVRGEDIRFPGTAQITVRNPAPGGGTSNARTFTMRFAFLGESKLLAPAADSSTSADIRNTFAISWTHPTDSWRVMQNMDLNLRNEEGANAAWIRFTEAGPTTTLSLLNSAGTVVVTGTLISGVPSVPTLAITDTVTLHLDQTTFTGAGRTVIFTPTVTFGPAAIGAYNIGFRVDNEAGEIQDEDVLGSFTILPAGCGQAVESVLLNGPTTGDVATDYTFTSALAPVDATTPVTYTWSPEPQSGQGSANATYRFIEAGRHGISVSTENCGGFAGAAQDVDIQTQAGAALTITKTGPATARAGDPITYTVTVANTGGASATNLTVRDELPAGATHVSGGTLEGSTVTWSLPALDGFGTMTATNYVVTAQSTITNSVYSVSADGGLQSGGAPVVTTKIVDAQVELTPVITGTLSHAVDGSAAKVNAADAVQTTAVHKPDAVQTTAIVIPAGAVFADTVVTYEVLAAPPAPPAGMVAIGSGFTLNAYQAHQVVADFTFGTPISVRVDGIAAGQLYHWDGAAWSMEAISCEAAPTAQLTCILGVPAAVGHYAIFHMDATGAPQIFLPLINR